MDMKKMNHEHARIISLYLLVAAVMSITSCTNSKRDNYADANGTMNIDFCEDGMIRNGTECDTYQVEEGQKGIISICVSKVSGRLDIDVYQVDSKHDPDYTGRNLDSGKEKINNLLYITKRIPYEPGQKFDLARAVSLRNGGKREFSANSDCADNPWE